MSDSENNIALKIVDASKSYKNNQILHNLNLKARFGELLCILGPSGVGKTTLLRLIAKLENLDSGNISLSREIFIESSNLNKGITYVFQEPALFPSLTIEENLDLDNTCRKTNSSTFESALKDIDLVNRAKEKIDYLSGGERKRISFGRCLIKPSKLILLDEPLSEVDYHYAKSLYSKLKQNIYHYNICCIYITHNPFEAFEIADRIALIDMGRLWEYDIVHFSYYFPPTFRLAELLGYTNYIKISKILECNHNYISAETDTGDIIRVNNYYRYEIDDLKNSTVLIRPESIRALSPNRTFDSKSDLLTWDAKLISKYWTPFGIRGKILFKNKYEFLISLPDDDSFISKNTHNMNIKVILNTKNVSIIPKKRR